MKYWVFQSNKVNGPYEPAELSRLPGFSAETLVCPEGRAATSRKNWQRAGETGSARAASRDMSTRTSANNGRNASHDGKRERMVHLKRNGGAKRSTPRRRAREPTRREAA